jgi:hypothetical protein
MRVEKTSNSGNTVVSSKTEDEYVALLSEGEDHAWEALQQCIAHAGGRVADTSWSRFDQAQLDGALQHHRGGGAAAAGTNGVDWKSRLNIFLQQRDRPACTFGEGAAYVCTYDATRAGPPHSPVFRATVTVSGVTFEGDERPTKKASEQTAAYVALGNLSLDAGSLQIDHSAAPAWAFSHGGGGDGGAIGTIDLGAMSLVPDEGDMFDDQDAGQSMFDE